eukprot:646129-Pleurochrysis_carterae.AAC.4
MAKSDSARLDACFGERDSANNVYGNRRVVKVNIVQRQLLCTWARHCAAASLPVWHALFSVNLKSVSSSNSQQELTSSERLAGRSSELRSAASRVQTQALCSTAFLCAAAKPSARGRTVQRFGLAADARFARGVRGSPATGDGPRGPPDTSEARAAARACARPSHAARGGRRGADGWNGCTSFQKRSRVLYSFLHEASWLKMFDMSASKARTIKSSKGCGSFFND